MFGRPLVACIVRAREYKRGMERRAAQHPKRLPKWHFLRCWCLVWLVFCQFPHPVAHSHDQLALVDPVGLHHHLQAYHHAGGGLQLGCQSDSCAHRAPDSPWHWHWVLPGELNVWSGGEIGGPWIAQALEPTLGMALGALPNRDAGSPWWCYPGMTATGYKRPSSLHCPPDLGQAGTFSAVSLTALYCIRLC